MRVLRTESILDDRLQFVDIDNESTSYAILSHTWASDSSEVLFADVVNGTYRERAGYSKVKSALQQARNDGYMYMWIDNCCIDKSSSAELSEALNAMYEYYESSDKCYAYMVDVTSGSVLNGDWWAFQNARWWTRGLKCQIHKEEHSFRLTNMIGWCLQELLAPKQLLFFDRDWIAIGTKLSRKTQVCEITGIDTGYLDGSLSIESASIAQRMSWAARRETKRPEDIAYCLMGLFQVNMPMLYGEGKRAFLRLQQEIMSRSDDQSLFAWTIDGDRGTIDYRFKDLHGLLADHPRQFRSAGSIFSYTDWEGRKPYSMTNRGLSIELHLSTTTFGKDIFTVALQCKPWQSEDGYLYLFLKRLPGSLDQYARVACQVTGATSRRGKATMIFVKQSLANTPVQVIYPHHFFVLGSVTHRINGWRGYKITQTFQQGGLTSLETEHCPKPAPSVYQVAKGVSTVFSIAKEARSLSVAMISELEFPQARLNYRPQTPLKARPNVIVMLGTMAFSEPGFDICEAPTYVTPPFSDLQACFQPQKMGTDMRLGFWKFRVTTEEILSSGTKVYYVSLSASRINDEDSERDGEETGVKYYNQWKAVVLQPRNFDFPGKELGHDLGKRKSSLSIPAAPKITVTDRSQMQTGDLQPSINPL